MWLKKTFEKIIFLGNLSSLIIIIELVIGIAPSGFNLITRPSLCSESERERERGNNVLPLDSGLD